MPASTHSLHVGVCNGSNDLSDLRFIKWCNWYRLVVNPVLGLGGLGRHCIEDHLSLDCPSVVCEIVIWALSVCANDSGHAAGRIGELGVLGARPRSGPGSDTGYVCLMSSWSRSGITEESHVGIHALGHRRMASRSMSFGPFAKKPGAPGTPLSTQFWSFRSPSTCPRCSVGGEQVPESHAVT